MTLQATTINLTLGGRTILTDASVQVDPGRVIGLLGPNGAGKSTLLRSLAGLEPAAEGTRAINGEAAPTRANREWACKVAYLPQTGDLSWPVTVREVVALGRLPHHTGPWGSQSAQDRAIVDLAMQQADVSSLADRPADTLSGGERTRMMLARALATEPDYLLADEPVAGLDPGHQLQVMELLRTRADAGMGLLVVLHDLTLACRYCDTVMLLLAGRVVAQGNPVEVLNPDNLANVFGVRVLAANTPDGPIRVPMARLPEDVP